MLFNSFEFLLFFPIVTLIFFLLPHKWRWLHLLIASCIFYMAFIPVYILILIFTIIIDYYAGIFIEEAEGKRRKWWLGASLVANVGILVVFKYYNFFISNINESFGLQQTTPLPLLNIILPIGLSFHTFQAMSYTIEVYRGKEKAERHFGIYSLYVLFYPQLVAGPIERPQNLLFQFHTEQKWDTQRVYEGLKLMLWGLFKKVVIADRLSLYVDQVYGAPQDWPGANIIVASVLFAIQIYCDFSGYSDMAIGSAKVMGFKLMTNFNRPYFARNIQEFWKRWHISLSTWFRDYLYISLGGNRVSNVRRYLNVAIVFLVSGFWHGANWTFIIWGAVHAVLITGYTFYKEYINKSHKSTWLGNMWSLALTFGVVVIAWVFFRASSASEAFYMIGQMFQADFGNFTLNPKADDAQFGNTSALIALFMIGLLFVNERYQDVLQTRLNNKPYLDVAFNTMILFFIIAFGVFQRVSFIYFQF
ncbi:MBOAT family O-acyltransferase [Flaviaesturariibacter amylovorans]|uniref:MBOAT family protein n=1 Tax=Flaviaesturariibacter amylovorans TaxID=1084520 RepID=A0ABP8GBI7_9BACT